MLRYTADRRTIGFILAHLVILVLGWHAWNHAPLVGRSAIVVLLAVSSWINAVIVHNVMHTPIWRARTLNRITQLVLSITYGFPVSEYVPGHNMSHHRFTQQPRDVMRTTKLRYHLNLLNLLFFFARIGPGVTLANAHYTRVMRRQNPGWYYQLLAEIAVAWGTKAALFAIDWRRAFWLALVPSLYAAWGITTVNYLQHDGCDEGHPYNHSRNFTGELFNWFTFNNGFHGIHHVRPGLHWSLSRRAHEVELAPYVDPRLDRPSLVGYLVETFVWPGKRCRYDGTPLELPAETRDQLW